MKKGIFCVLFLSVVLLAAFADHPRNLSLGVVGGTSYGSAGFGGGDAGLALHLADIPVYMGISLKINSERLGLGITGDLYIYDRHLVSEKSFDLDWFLGLGGYANFGFMDSGINGALGIRVPVGLSWHIDRPIELWLDIAPGLGYSIEPLEFPDWNIVAEIGFRYWFTR